ncbi:hypothetical protein [Sinomicrobium weinanense]|uniref:Uncharacterized protein n=1 Tax=Sinomicrobium weinanense TaxID=2842200 RepID=A0A926JTE4_9FLAO|nr:hypothetical protein [Sinomicrobium weinanense]MBC9797029.1 hypothetical protein [Sinomicrobium weinanense]MBU3122024.1 hypothetical protein [Sinomicrobium weinanense]
MKTGNKYAIEYEFSVPSEIMINDIVLDIDLQDGAFGPEFINHYILNDGEQTVRIKLMHPFVERGGKLTPNEVKRLSENLAIHNVKPDENYEVEVVKKLSFPELKDSVPYIEHKWTFETNLPFELQGWKNSEDLTQWDEKELEKEVVAKFRQLRDLLNSGNGAGFMEEIKKCNEEYFTANYFTEDEKKEYTTNLLDSYSSLKGLVPPIQNYNLRIMGNGRVVTLESTGKYKGQCILTTENKDQGSIYQIYVMLHKPQGAKDFEVVRINGQIAGMEE